MGYHRAGFDEIVGVDINPQKNYPFEFIQADAMEFPLEGFDAIHASPPCQAFTSLNKMHNAKPHADLLTPTRERLQRSGLPFVIENVPGAPLRVDLMLCGSMFYLGTPAAELRRHRNFELSHPSLQPACKHGWRSCVIGVYGGHGRDRRRKFNTQNFSVAERQEAMGIDWMNGTELSQAIPPAYTEYIGRAMLAAMDAESVA